MNEAHIDRLREMREHYDNEAAGAAALDVAISALKKQERYEALLEAARRFVKDDAGDFDHDDLYHAVAALEDE